MGIINAGWFGIVAGLLGGLAISYFFYRKSVSRVSVAVEMNHATIVAPEQPDDKLEVRYDGRAVPRVTRTVVGIWNNGTQTVRRSDVSRRDPLQIRVVGDGEILRVNMLGRSRDVNWAQNPGVSFEAAAIDFDFLDPGDGFSVEIIHSGSGISAAGTIEGMGRELGASKPPSKVAPLLAKIAGGMILLLIVVMALAFFGSLLFLAYQRPFPVNVLMSAGVVILAFLMWRSAREEPKADHYRIPGAPKAVSDSLIANMPWLQTRR